MRSTASPTSALARFLPLVIVAVTVVCYVNTLPNEFVFDDEWYILDQPLVQDLDAALTEAWSQRRPLLLISFALNYYVDGFAQPGYKAVNLLIHALAGLALFGLVRRTLELPCWAGRFDTTSRYLAGAVALLWVAHPLATQAVSYTVQRGESMMGLFLFTTLYLYALAASRQHNGARLLCQALAVLACLAGMLSKESMVVAPLLVLVYDAVFLAGSPGGFLKRRAWVVAGLFLTWLVLIDFVDASLVQPMVTPTGQRSESVGLGVASVTPWEYLQTQAWVITVVYLPRVFAPVNLVLDYFLPPLTGWRVIAPFAFLAVGFLVSLLGVILRRWWGFVGLGFYLALAPTSSVLPVTDLAVEHRMYVPLAFAVALVVGVCSAAGRWLLRNGWLRPHSAVGLGAVATLACLVVLCVLTVQRNAEYRTRVGLWQTVVERRPGNPRGLYNLGSALQKANRYREAIGPYEAALRIVPTYAEARNGLATSYGFVGMPGLAERQYLIGLGHTPRHEKLNYNYGRMLLRRGEAEKSLAYFEQAIETDPEHSDARSNLGTALLALGRIDEAEAQWRRALADDPGAVFAASNLVALLINRGEVGQAVSVARSIRRDPRRNLAMPWHVLGRALLRAGELGEAEQALRQATDREEPLLPAAVRLMELMIRQGRVDEASAVFEQITGRTQDPRLGAQAAWVLATTPLPNGSGARAMSDEAVLTLARNVVRQQAPRPSAQALEALAAAQANAGQFDVAARTQRQAIQSAADAPMTDWQRKRMRQRLELYESGQRYTEVVGLRG